jgi:pyruvate/2-oxoglutarate/acetoin dehydrogenase E1 component
MEGELAAEAGPVDIEYARVRRPGRDISVITYGMSLWKSLEAARSLAERVVDAEVVDLRTLRPLDERTLVESVSHTHRALIVDEGWRSGGISAEISARLMEQAFYDLDAPVQRFCGAEVPMPYAAPLERASIPQTETIAAAIEGMVRSHG